MADSTETTTDLLERIDSKLAALLALVLDAHLRESGIAKPKGRALDRLLTDAGQSPQTIGALLGKTDRAVTKMLQSEREAEAAKKTARAKTNGRA
jgi:hypothetical protein